MVGSNCAGGADTPTQAEVSVINDQTAVLIPAAIEIMSAELSERLTAEVGYEFIGTFSHTFHRNYRDGDGTWSASKRRQSGLQKTGGAGSVFGSPEASSKVD